MKGSATYDPEADAIGIYFAPEGAVYDGSEEIAPGLTLDFDRDGRVIGVEILGVRAFLQNRKLPPGDTATASVEAAD